MDIPRIPSGIFFNLNPAVPSIDQESRPNPKPPIGSQPSIQPDSDSKNLGFRGDDLYAFRIADVSADENDTDRRYLPLLEISIDVKVIATTSRTLLKQTFMNYSGAKIKQATYCFPLYDGSAIIGFRCWIGNDTVLEGQVKAKEAAKADFLNAVSQQRTSALLEELTPEVFETSLGNIPPHATVKVEIIYVNELKVDLGGDGVLVTIPTSVAPRYGTPPGYHSQELAAARKNLPEENGLRIQIEVSSPVPIRKLESRTHPIAVELGSEVHPTSVSSFRGLASTPAKPEFDPGKARATLSDRATTLGKDFVLLILAAGSTLLASRALLEPHPDPLDHSALKVTVNPREFLDSQLAIEDAKTEIIFLADRSGSMADKIGALRTAMRIFLKSIPRYSSFNICSFGTYHSLLWPASKPYTEESLDFATQHVTHAFGSDMGGTEILSALEGAVATRNTQGDMTTQIILLTDGEVWDEENVIKFVQETRKTTENRVRFFALGIGDTVSHRLVEGVGQQGGGFAEVVAVDAAGRWESRVIRMLKGALAPTQWQLEINLPQNIDNAAFKNAGSENFDDVVEKSLIRRPLVMQAPNITSSVHPFLRLSIYFLVDPQLLLQRKSITVQAMASSGEKFKLEIPLEHVEARALTIHHLAAKALMNDLESGRSWINADQNQSFWQSDPVAFERAVQEEAENIGMKWGISGKWTSFVALDKKDQTQRKSRIYRAEYSELTALTRRRSNLICIQPSHRSSASSGLHSYPYRFINFGAFNSKQGSSNPIILNSTSELSRRSVLSATSELASSNILNSTPDLPCPIELPLSAVALSRDYDQQSFKGSENWPCMIQTESYENDTEYQRDEGIFSHNKFVDDQFPGALPEITLDDLICQQAHQGYFNVNELPLRSQLLCHFSSNVISELNQCFLEVGGPWKLLHRSAIKIVNDTVLVVAFIEARYPESSELWELVIRKAENWLKLRASGSKRFKKERLLQIAQDNLKSLNSTVLAVKKTR